MLLDIIDDYKYKNAISILYKNFPLIGIEGPAFEAAEATLCAREQGKFPEFHIQLMERTSRLGRDLYRYIVRIIHLNEQNFFSCLDSRRYKDTILEEKKDADAQGIDGVPDFIVTFDGMRIDKPLPRSEEDIRYFFDTLFEGPYDKNDLLKTDTWRTYTHTTLGFTFNYPKEFALANKTNTTAQNPATLLILALEAPRRVMESIGDARISINIADNPLNLATTEWMRENGYTTNELFETEQQEYGALAGSLEQKTLTINGIEAIEYDRGMEGDGSHTVLIPFDKKIFVVNGASESYLFNNARNTDTTGVTRKIFDGIVNSFRPIGMVE
jgi:hypothetical protein